MKTRINSRRHRMGTGYSRLTPEQWAHFCWTWSGPAAARHCAALEAGAAAGLEGDALQAHCRKVDEQAWAEHLKASQATA